MSDVEVWFLFGNKNIWIGDIKSALIWMYLTYHFHEMIMNKD